MHPKATKWVFIESHSRVIATERIHLTVIIMGSINLKSSSQKIFYMKLFIYESLCESSFSLDFVAAEHKSGGTF